MARLLKLAELEARKKALVAESEIYRQTLKLELRNIQLSVASTGRKLSRYKSLFAIVPVGSSLLGMLAAGLLRRRKGPAKSSWSGILPTALTGWRLYQKFGPTLRPLILKFLGRKRRAKALAENRTPAANI